MEDNIMDRFNSVMAELGAPKIGTHGEIGRAASTNAREKILPMQVRILQGDSDALVYLEGYPLKRRSAAPGTPLIDVEIASLSDEPYETPSTVPRNGSDEEETSQNDACATAREISYSSQGHGAEGTVKISDTSICENRWVSIAISDPKHQTNSSERTILLQLRPNKKYISGSLSEGGLIPQEIHI